MYLSRNKYRAWSLELYFCGVRVYLELLDTSVKLLTEKTSKEKSWNKGFLHKCYYSVFPLQLFILSVIVLQAMTNPFTLKTINGMFETVCGGGGCMYIHFFSDFPWHPLSNDSITPYLHTGQHLYFKLQHCTTSKLEQTCSLHSQLSANACCWHGGNAQSTDWAKCCRPPEMLLCPCCDERAKGEETESINNLRGMSRD